MTDRYPVKTLELRELEPWLDRKKRG